MLLHFIVPLIVVLLFYKVTWKASYLIMMATMSVDFDHLLATPIYDPQRCSIGFHPLHEPIVILLYAFLIFPRQTRVIGLGLLIHMALDSIDCFWTNHIWYVS